MSDGEQFDLQLTPSNRHIWTWAIRGYGGVTTILERLVDSKMPIDDDHLEGLRWEVERLQQLLSKLMAREHSDTC